MRPLGWSSWQPRRPRRARQARRSAPRSAQRSFCFFVYFALDNSTQNTASVPQERTLLQIVCAPATVTPTGQAPANAALKALNPSTAAAGRSPSLSRLPRALRHVHEYASPLMPQPPHPHATYPPPPPSPRTPGTRRSRTPGRPTILLAECASDSRRRTAAHSPPSPEQSTIARDVPLGTSCAPLRPHPALALPTPASARLLRVVAARRAHHLSSALLPRPSTVRHLQ